MKHKSATNVFIHPTALVEKGVVIGDDTKIWHHVHIRQGVRIGKQCNFGKGAYIDEGVRIGNRVKIHNYASLFKHCEIEDHVFIGPYVVITNDIYPRAVTPKGSLKTEVDWECGTTIIKKGASIGAGAILVPNSMVGEYAMVGAGTVVTEIIPAHALVMGNPGRVVGFICKCGKHRQKHKPSKLPLVCGRCKTST